jgi:hypothetical protein
VQHTIIHQAQVLALLFALLFKLLDPFLVLAHSAQVQRWVFPFMTRGAIIKRMPVCGCRDRQAITCTVHPFLLGNCRCVKNCQLRAFNRRDCTVVGGLSACTLLENLLKVSLALGRVSLVSDRSTCQKVVNSGG